MDGSIGLVFALIGLGCILNIERRLKHLEASANGGKQESTVVKQRGWIAQEAGIKVMLVVGFISLFTFAGIHAYCTWVFWRCA